MSTRHIPYPPDFDVDYHVDLAWQRRQRALKALEIGDVLSVLDNLIASEPDPTKHPCYALVAFLLDQQLAVDGGHSMTAGNGSAWTPLTGSSSSACRRRTKPWTRTLTTSPPCPQRPGQRPDEGLTLNCAFPPWKSFGHAPSVASPHYSDLYEGNPYERHTKIIEN